MAVVDLYDAIKTAVATTGLKVVDNPLALPNPPAAVVLPPEFNPSAFGAERTYTFRVLVFTSTSGEGSSFNKLLGYADATGSTSIDAAISAATIGEDAAVTGFRPLGVEEVAAYQAFGGEFTVEVFD